MWQYWSHFKYTVAHKWYVFLECVKMGIFWRGVFHDLSKFTPSEFCQYANYFFDTDGSRFSVHDDYVRTIEFERAWFHHLKKNDHHWQYWIEYPYAGKQVVIRARLMDLDAMKETVCDMRGSGRAQHVDDPQNPLKWYTANREHMILNPETRFWLETEIGYKPNPE